MASPQFFQEVALGDRIVATRFRQRFAIEYWRLILVLILAGLIWAPFFSVAQIGSQQSQISEYELKAVYLYNFLHFVHWPKEPEPRVIAVVGSSPFKDALTKLQARLQKTGKKSISIQYLGPYHQGMDFSRCNLLFISASEKKNFPSIITDLKSAPVLTVADTDSFLTAGGMIALVTSGNRIRWEINRTSVQEAGLRLNAKLLDIAVRVVSKPKSLESR